MARILITDKISPDAVSALKKKHEVVEFLEWTPEQLQKKIKGFDVLVIRSRTKVGKDLIDAADRLKIIARGGSGLDNVDQKHAQSKGIKVINTPTANLLSVAELTLGLALSLSRQIPRADRGVRSGLWEKKELKGTEISGKKWGIIGFGNVGKLVAGLLSGFQCELLAYDPYVTKEAAAPFGVQMLPLDKLLKKSDIVSIHVPLLDSTRNLIGAKELSMMKPSAILISISRGGIVDETALYNALKDRKLAGAALDVFETEPPTGSPLLSLDNLVFTPHIGGQTTDAQKRVGEQLVEKLLAELK